MIFSVLLLICSTAVLATLAMPVAQTMPNHFPLFIHFPPLPSFHSSFACFVHCCRCRELSSVEIVFSSSSVPCTSAHYQHELQPALARCCCRHPLLFLSFSFSLPKIVVWQKCHTAEQWNASTLTFSEHSSTHTCTSTRTSEAAVFSSVQHRRWLRQWQREPFLFLSSHSCHAPSCFSHPYGIAWRSRRFTCATVFSLLLRRRRQRVLR